MKAAIIEKIQVTTQEESACVINNFVRHIQQCR